MRKEVIFGWLILLIALSGIWMAKRLLDRMGNWMYEPSDAQVEERRIVDACFSKLNPPVFNEPIGSKKWVQVATRCFDAHQHEHDPEGTKIAKRELERERTEAASEESNNDHD